MDDVVLFVCSGSICVVAVFIGSTGFWFVLRILFVIFYCVLLCVLFVSLSLFFWIFYLIWFLVYETTV